MREQTERILILGLYDHVDASEAVAELFGQSARVGSQAASSAFTPDLATVTASVARLVASLVDGGLAMVGDLRDDDDVLVFVPWDLTADEAEQRILHEWAELGRLPALWELFWLQNTPSGDAVARAAMEKGRASARPDAPPP